jgi:hypothetical protein
MAARDIHDPTTDTLRANGGFNGIKRAPPLRRRATAPTPGKGASADEPPQRLSVVILAERRKANSITGHWVKFTRPCRSRYGREVAGQVDESGKPALLRPEVLRAKLLELIA